MTVPDRATLSKLFGRPLAEGGDDQVVQGLTAAQIGDLGLQPGKGWLPVSGSSAGYEVSAVHGPNDENWWDWANGAADPKATYQLRYTPSYEGAREAQRQAAVSSAKEDALIEAIGMMIVTGGLGGAFGGTSLWGSLGSTGAAAAEGGAAAAGAGAAEGGAAAASSGGGGLFGSGGIYGTGVSTGSTLGNTVAQGAIRGAVTSGLQGGNPWSGALTGAATSGFGSVVDTGSPLGNSMATGAFGSAISGGNPITGAMAGGLNSAAKGNGMGWADTIGSWFGGDSSSSGGDMSIGDIGNYLSGEVANGNLTEEQAMEAMRAYNNAASGGEWNQYNNDQPITGYDIGSSVSGGNSGGAGSRGISGSSIAGLLGNKGLGALAGGMLAGSSLGNAKQAGTTTTTTVPWAPMQPYLTGLAADAQALYRQNQGTPSQMSNIANMAMRNSIGYQGLSGLGQDMAYQASGGAFDPVLNQVGNINARQGFSSMGNLDPSGAYAQMLSGQVNPYVDQMAQSLANQANQNLNLNVMPSIRSGAQSAGQYGSSRQGIAEGVAAGLSNQGLSNSLSGLYGNAWNTAQGQMASAASQLGSVGNNNQQFNAQLGLNQNAQNMQAANQALQARQAGMGLGTSSYGLGNGALTDAYNMQSHLAQYPWQNLRNYQSVVHPLGGMGSSQATPYYTNQANNILGGALAGATLLGGK